MVSEEYNRGYRDGLMGRDSDVSSYSELDSVSRYRAGYTMGRDEYRYHMSMEEKLQIEKLRDDWDSTIRLRR